MPESGKILHLDQTFICVPDETNETDTAPSAKSLPDDAAVVDMLMRVITENQKDVVSQLSGYIITEDPAYLPDTDDARALARRIGRDKLLDVLITSYMETHITNE